MKLFLLVMGFLLCSCSVVSRVPMTRFESPETRGKQFGFEGQLAYQARNDILLTPDFTMKAPSLSDPSVESSSHRLMANGSLGILDGLDINVTVPEPRFGLKYQLAGDAHAEAKAGNFPIALSGGLAWKKQEESAQSLASTSMRTYEMSEFQTDLALIFGYRFTDSLLAYSGPFLTLDKIHTSFQPSAAGAKLEDKKTARQIGMNLGLQLDQGSMLGRVEVAGTKMKLGGASVGRAAYGLAIGKTF